MRGATRSGYDAVRGHRDFNPRSPCGERREIIATVKQVKPFQPTLPVRGATQHPLHVVRPVVISTHAPRAGSDRRRGHCATRGRDFNPRSPCGERRPWATISARLKNFNPRSPCGERPLRNRWQKHSTLFQPTLPVRGATAKNTFTSIKTIISTHAPRAGSDVGQFSHHARHKHFNPRSPCGERRAV